MTHAATRVQRRSAGRFAGRWIGRLPARRLVGWATVLTTVLLAACAHKPPEIAVAPLLHDEFFAASADVPDEAAVFALSDGMRRYADQVLAQPSAPVFRDGRRALLDALTRTDGLRLGYDASRTRNAAEAFEARAGNCLSLVIMTAAFARHLGLPVHYQAVDVQETYTRQGDITFGSGHVNVVLGRPPLRSAFASGGSDDITVDFLPGTELRGQRTSPLAEATVIAMYFNNRAAEALAEGRVADSYAWARAALLRDSGFAPALNTLAVLYLRGGHLGQAETVLRTALGREPDYSASMSNLVRVLLMAGRSDEAAVVQRQLAKIQPEPPFQQFELGREAMAQGQYRLAIEHFERELRQQPLQAEVHFWLAQAHWRLGETARAARHLRLAMENSTTRGSHDLYAAKLARLRELQLQ